MIPGEPSRVSLGAVISSLVFSSRIFLRGSWETSRWFLAWAAVNSLSTGVVVCSRRELGWLVSFLMQRFRRGSGDWNILIVHRRQFVLLLALGELLLAFLGSDQAVHSIMVGLRLEGGIYTERTN